MVLAEYGIGRWSWAGVLGGWKRMGREDRLEIKKRACVYILSSFGSLATLMYCTVLILIRPPSSRTRGS